MLKDPSYKCIINAVEKTLVNACHYPDIKTATIEKLQEIFDSYNTKISKAMPKEKLKIIVDHVQKISQLHPFDDGNVRTCYVLLNRLLHQHGMPLTLMIDPNRFDGFDLDRLTYTIKEGQNAFLAWMQHKVPSYIDPDSNLEQLSSLEQLSRCRILPHEIPEEKKEIENFIQAITNNDRLIFSANCPLVHEKSFSTLRKIVHIAPGETARLSAEHTHHTDLLVRLSIKHTAIVFKDKFGNISVTHFDKQTSFEFVHHEKNYMKGDYSVDIIKHAEDKSEFAKNVMHAAIMRRLGTTVNNSKNNSDIRSTKTSNLLLKQGKLFTPMTEHLNDLMPVNSHIAVTSNNPLCDSELIEGVKPAKLRLLERFILQMTVKDELLPTVIYDDGWTGNYPILPTAAIIFSEQAYVYKADEAALKEKINSAAREFFGEHFDSLRMKAMLDMMPIILRKYWDYSSKNLYTRLFNFFKQPEQANISAKAIRLVTEYCEDEHATACATLCGGEESSQKMKF